MIKCRFVETQEIAVSNCAVGWDHLKCRVFRFADLLPDILCAAFAPHKQNKRVSVRCDGLKVKCAVSANCGLYNFQYKTFCGVHAACVLSCQNPKIPHIAKRLKAA